MRCPAPATKIDKQIRICRLCDPYFYFTPVLMVPVLLGLCYYGIVERPKLIVFDLNKTLIEENSWLNLNLAMGVTKAEDEQLMAWGQEGVITDAQGQAILCGIYKARGHATKDRINEVLHAYQYREGAQETVKQLGEMGFKLALVSGSMDILVEHVANELGIELWASNNHFHFDEDGHLERIETVDNDDKYKLNQLEQICQDLGIMLEEAWCVGDGDNDGLLFDATGNGITFEGSSIAFKAKQVVKSLYELPDLLPQR